MYVAKLVEVTHLPNVYEHEITLLYTNTYIKADKIFPNMEIIRILFLPYLSDNDPIMGDTTNCNALWYEDQKQSLVIDAGGRLTRRQNPLDRLGNDVSIRVSIHLDAGKPTQ
jgi:hypothetical protein